MPAAAASSGSRVPALRWHVSQVERSRGRESRGCPGGTWSRAISELARLRDNDDPPTRNSCPAEVANVRISSSHRWRTGTIRGDGAPTVTNTVSPPSTTSRALIRVTQRPSSPAPAPRAISARAARRRAGVRWSAPSALSCSSSAVEYGGATCLRDSKAGRGSQGQIS